VKRLEQRWQRRWEEPVQGPVRTFRIQESIKLRHTPERVWALVAPAEHAVLLMPESVARGFTVPGRAKGLGEQQCMLDLDGNATIHEVIEYIEARRAVTRWVSPPPPVPVRATHNLEPLGQGCILSVGMEFDSPVGTVWPQQQQDEWRHQAQRYLERARRLLDQEADEPGTA
jgi:hypothetical protein